MTMTYEGYRLKFGLNLYYIIIINGLHKYSMPHQKKKKKLDKK